MSIQFVNHVITIWNSLTGTRQMVVWDAGLETPVSSTFWDNGTTNWIA